MTAINRRRALAGSAAVAVGVPLLAACGDDAASTATAPATSGGSQDPGASPGGAAGGALAATSDVPVGGGTIFDEQKVVVTQPSEGDFKAFTSICTHQGCPVTSIADGTINCTCHGSKFSIDDGSVVAGPATRALDAVDITVEGDAISLA